MLDFDLFTRVIDEAGPSLGRVDFFNYGEAFLHKRAVEMCEYIKTKYPHIYLYTSTNGLALNEERARRLVHSGIDEVTFSIDGATQENYVKYRQRGDLKKALANLAAMADEKRKAGRDVPYLELALHPVQLERQRRGDGAGPENGCRRRRGSSLLGDYRPSGRRVLPPLHAGCAGLRAHRAGSLGHQRSGKRYSRRDATSRNRVRSMFPGLPLLGRPGRQVTIRTRVKNLSQRRFPANASYGRRLVRLGAQLCAADGTLIERDYARAWLPHHLEAGAEVEMRIDVPAPSEAGRYALKFDLVCEGIDWFETCGSQTTTRPLWVPLGRR